MASAASTAPTKPFVSTMPRASIFIVFSESEFLSLMNTNHKTSHSLRQRARGLLIQGVGNPPNLLLSLRARPRARTRSGAHTYANRKKRQRNAISQQVDKLFRVFNGDPHTHHMAAFRQPGAVYFAE